MNQLDALKQFTTVVADTGDFRQLAQFKPQDATTNPSLILKAVGKAEYRHLLHDTVAQAPQAADRRDHGPPAGAFRLRDPVGGARPCLHRGRRAPEFRHQATVARAERIIALYQAQGIASDRVLIKIASTWEGIQAAAALEQRGIHTNLTLLFSFSQAVACGQAGVQLISPFVGRIYDWYKKSAGAAWDEAAQAGVNDPGVLLGAQHLQPLQEVRHQDRDHGRQFSQHRPDSGAGRLRSADHQPGAAGRAGSHLRTAGTPSSIQLRRRRWTCRRRSSTRPVFDWRSTTMRWRRKSWPKASGHSAPTR